MSGRDRTIADLNLAIEARRYARLARRYGAMIRGPVGPCVCPPRRGRKDRHDDCELEGCACGRHAWDAAAHAAAALLELRAAQQTADRVWAALPLRQRAARLAIDARKPAHVRPDDAAGITLAERLRADEPLDEEPEEPAAPEEPASSEPAAAAPVQPGRPGGCATWREFYARLRA